MSRKSESIDKGGNLPCRLGVKGIEERAATVEGLKKG